MTATTFILGAGITGASVAYELSLRGQPVVVLDANVPAAEASGRSFGWINASFHLSEDHFRARAAAMALHRRLATDLENSGHEWTGALWWEGDLDQSAALFATLGYPAEEWGSARIFERVPALSGAPDRALFLPGEGSVDAAHLTRRLLDAAARRGAEVWSGCRIHALAVRDGAVSAIETSAGRIDAERVVIAAGTGSAAVLETIGLRVQMLARPGAMLRTRPLQPVLPVIIAAPDQEFRQTPSGAILAPCAASHQSDQADRIASPPAVLAHETLARLERYLPGVALRVAEVTLAERPVPGDGLPAVGPLPGVAGAWLAVLHSGVTLAPLVGMSIANEITGQRADPAMAPFGPARLISPF